MIAELARSASRRAGIDRVLRALPVVDTNRVIATRAGYLARNRLDSCQAVDAFVPASALDAGPAVVLTGDPGDPGDFSRLVGDDLGVHIRPLP